MEVKKRQRKQDGYIPGPSSVSTRNNRRWRASPWTTFTAAAVVVVVVTGCTRILCHLYPDVGATHFLPVHLTNGLVCIPWVFKLYECKSRRISCYPYTFQRTKVFKLLLQLLL